jgi:hypothetical protein
MLVHAFSFVIPAKAGICIKYKYFYAADFQSSLPAGRQAGNDGFSTVYF